MPQRVHVDGEPRLVTEIKCLVILIIQSCMGVLIVYAALCILRNIPRLQKNR